MQISTVREFKEGDRLVVIKTCDTPRCSSRDENRCYTGQIRIWHNDGAWNTDMKTWCSALTPDMLRYKDEKMYNPEEDEGVEIVADVKEGDTVKIIDLAREVSREIRDRLIGRYFVVTSIEEIYPNNWYNVYVRSVEPALRDGFSIKARLQKRKGEIVNGNPDKT